MSLEDQVYDRIIGLVLNQLAFAFGEDHSDEVNDKLYEIVSVKFTYESEIQKVLGHDSVMLDRANLISLAEQITLEELFNVDHAGADEIADYIAKFPQEKAKWLAHILSFLD